MANLICIYFKEEYISPPSKVGRGGRVPLLPLLIIGFIAVIVGFVYSVKGEEGAG